MAGGLPALSGTELIKLYEADGWEPGRRSRHGQTLRKDVGRRTRTVVIPTKPGSLTTRTLHGILGPKQSGIGRKGLERMLAGKSSE